MKINSIKMSLIASKLHQNYIKITSKLHQNYIKITSKLHQNYIKTTSKLHQNYIKISSKFYQNVIKCHQNFINQGQTVKELKLMGKICLYMVELWLCIRYSRKINYSGWWGGWVAGEAEIITISAFNWVEVEVEAELGKKGMNEQMNELSDMKMCSDVQNRVGTPHKKCAQMFILGWGHRT